MAELRIFEVEGPDGKVMRVQAPSDATDNQIIAKAKRMRFSLPEERAYDPTKGGTLNVAGLDTGMPMGAGPSRFTAGVGQHFTDMGLGMAQLVPGVDLTEEAKAKQALDAPLLSTTGGKAGKLTGALVPAVASMALPGANAYTGAAATGAMLGLLEPTTTGASGKLWSGAAGGLAGVGGRALGELAGAAVQPVANSLNPEAQRLAALAQSMGIPLDAAARTGSKPLQTLNAVFENLPMTAGREAAKKRATQEAFDRAVLQKTGSPATSATPDVLAQQKQVLGAEFERIAKNNSIQVTPQFEGELRKIQAEAAKRLTPKEAATVAGMVDDILGQVPQNRVNPGPIYPPFFGKPTTQPGALLGTEYQGFRSELGRLSKGNDARAYYFGKLKRVLDDEFSAQLSAADAAAWKEASREYGNLKTLLNAQGGAGNAAAQGNVSPAQLAQSVASQVTREGRALGRGDMNDLARIGQLFVRDQVPNSGTAQRMAYQSLLTGGMGAPAAGAGFLMTGSPTAGAMYGAAAGAASLMTPRLVQALMNNQAAQRYMVRQSGSPAAAALADTLRRMGPSIGLSAAPLLANGAQQ